MGLFSRKQDRNDKPAPSRSASSRRGVDRDDPLDPAVTLKRRARRRLIGAVALVLGAVVFLPMVFDSEPKQPIEDISVQIPDRNTPFTPTMPDQTPAAPVKPVAPPTAVTPTDPVTSAVPGATALVPVPAPGSSTASVVAPPPTSAVPAAKPVETKPVAKAEVKAEAKSETKSEAKSEAKPAVKPEVKPDPKPDTKSKPAADDPRAVAALEGKDIGTTSKEAPKAASGSYAVQIGAFASADKVKELRDRLSAAGLKVYTESLKTPQGDRTRVRLGPYASRDAADKARDRAKGLGLDGPVVPL